MESCGCWRLPSLIHSAASRHSLKRCDLLRKNFSNRYIQSRASTKSTTKPTPTSRSKPKDSRSQGKGASVVAATRQSTAAPIRSFHPFLKSSATRSTAIRSDLWGRTMAITAELALAPTSDSDGASIYLHAEKGSYIFGRLPEGTQRAFNSRKLGLAGVENIFLSGTHCWQQLGGLLGSLLTIVGGIASSKEGRDAENAVRKSKGQAPWPDFVHPGFQLHGTENLAHILAACRAIVFRQKLKLRVLEHRDDPRATDPTSIEPDWADENIRVWKIPTRRARSSSPPKRRHGSLDETTEDDENFLGSSKPSSVDSDVALFMLETVMFSDAKVWTSTRLDQLKPTDPALCHHNGMLSVYRGPYATDGAEIPNPGGTAYVLRPSGTHESAYERSDLNHSLLPATSYSDTSISYIVRAHDRRGKFNAAEAKRLGLQPKQFRILSNGESATTADGKVVTPEMVLGDPIPGRGLIVADIASIDFLESFLERPEWSNAKLMDPIVTMYWILGPGLAGDARIHKFIDEHAHIKHVLCSQDTCPNMIVHVSPSELQTKLRCIDSDRYPLPHFSNTVDFDVPKLKSEVELGRAGRQLQLMPNLLFNTREAAPFANLAEAAQDIDPEIMALAREARAKATDADFLARVEKEEQDIPNRDAEITALGTGSSQPSKYRNVSGTLVRVPGIGNYLFDCGEGSLGQLRRLFGEEETQNILRDLKCIVISHLHADHLLGTPLLVKAWYEQTLKEGSNANLAICCIDRFKTTLEELSQVEDIGFHRLRFLCSKQNGESNNTARKTLTAKDLGEENFGLKGVKRIPVPHCWMAAATELELTSGLRIAYSGDCRPSADFARACKGTHLLIHECTFGDDMLESAKAKRHSTMSEAMGVARNMDARRVFLTHFSQRYIKRMRLSYDTANYDGQVYVLASDFMSLKLGDFQKAACFLPVTQRLIESLAVGE